jgi:hypothetical protein
VKILEIYKKYQIMPQLAEHQFRVAAVAIVVLDNLSPLPNPPLQGEGRIEVDRENIIKACLLHDMGNIIKYDIKVSGELYPEKFSQEDLKYWQKVKEEYIKKYGPDEHRASLEIAKAAGANERVLGLINAIGFQYGKNNAQSEDFGRKICAYSDMRVGPYGVITLEERFLDLRKRYDNKHRLMGGNEDLRLDFENGLREIEKQIFARCNIKPEDITEDSIKLAMEKLRNFEI